MFDPNRYPALVLNADFTPLSIIPMETWHLDDVLRAVVKDRIFVVEEYDRDVHSQFITMRIPSVVALKEYQSLERRAPWNRVNLFVRDHGGCQFCGLKLSMDEMTVDHVLPKSRGGRTGYANCVACCDPCNLRKANRLPAEAGMPTPKELRHPTIGDLNRTARKMRLAHLSKSTPSAWLQYLAA